MDREDLINELGEIIYVSDPKTYELLYTNAYGKTAMALPECEGRPCYKMLQDRDTPCPFCTNDQLRYDKFLIWEYTNPRLGRHFLLKDKLIDWKGKPARLEIALDITEQEVFGQEIQKELRAAQTLVDCIRSLASAETLEEAVGAVLAGIGSFYQADRAYILELDDAHETASNTFEWCAPGVEPMKEKLQNVLLRERPFWENAIHAQELVRIEDTETLKETYPEEYENQTMQGIRCLMAAPFMIREEHLGYIGVDNPSFHADDPTLLQSVSYFVINEVHKRRSHELLEYQSCHDSLTGLLNRLQYHKDAEAMKEHAPEAVGVVFCDINGLKKVNDTQGHNAGDLLIIRCAEILRHHFPEGRVYRLSGDEFVVLCPNADKAEFGRLVQEAQERFAMEGGGGVSMGYVWENRNIDLDRMIRRADKHMYENKQHHYEARET